MEIGKLTPVNPREVWRHEALNFTPWLAGQIDHLAEAIGEDLEVLGSETAVGPFSADIVARNRLDGHTVLIENQLEKTDHTHLGQIMTYLAGLEAKTVVWIATRFQEEHVSAIRWLNDHTPPEFRFFAVELRVVQIGQSPVAPIFDIIVRPNAFERNLKVRKAEAEASADTRHRDFWDLYLQRHPGDTAIGMKPTSSTNIWLPVGEGIVVGAYLAKGTGVYVRGQAANSLEAVVAKLEPHRAVLEARTGAPFSEGNKYSWLLVRAGLPFGDASTWPAVADWLHEQLNRHVAALRDVLSNDPGAPAAGGAA